MNKKMTNAQNVTNFKKREYLRYAIMITSIITIVLAVLSLTINLNFIFALIPFAITIYLKRVRENTEIEMSKKLKELKAEKKKK